MDQRESNKSSSSGGAGSSLPTNAAAAAQDDQLAEDPDGEVNEDDCDEASSQSSPASNSGSNSASPSLASGSAAAASVLSSSSAPENSSNSARAATAANHSGRSSASNRQPQNRGATNHQGSAAVSSSGASSASACVNANHGSRSHSRNSHRDGHHHHHHRERHHRERHRQSSGGSRERSRDAASNNNAQQQESVSNNEESDNVIAAADNNSSAAQNQANELSLPTPLGGALCAALAGAAAPNAQALLPPNHVVQYNWQAARSTIKERLAFMFNNETMADVHFLVGKGGNTQRIPAHRFVLAIGSAVFDAMFNGGMATKSAEVELPDVEPAAFLALLKFLYSDEVHIGPETVMTTLYTAKKYAVPALEQACVDFLKRNLCSENAFMLLTQARLFDESQLAALCLESIDKNTSEALAAEGFIDIDLETLAVVLERDTLGIRECKLFNAACKWSEAECIRQNLAVTSVNQRKVMGRALQLIRFPLMTVEEFAMGAAQSGILSDREVVELFLHFTVNPKPSVQFQDTPRCCLTGKEQVVSRFCQIESRWGYSGTSDRIRFMVNRRIFVVGFGLYGSIHGPAEYTVNIQILHTDSGKVCGQNDTTFQCDGTNSTFRVMFKEPIEIQPNGSFTACATLKGPDSYYGTKGLRKVTHESVTSGKVTFQFTYAAGNNNGTSVEDGQIPEIIFYT